MSELSGPASWLVATLGLAVLVLVSLIALRLTAYWVSMLFFWKRYRVREVASDEVLFAHRLPHLKIQITTRGSAGSTEVIARGINGVLRFARSSPSLAQYVSVEVVTESQEQVDLLEAAYANESIRVSGLRVPPDYQTPNGTGLKARGLHYAVEQRRLGWNVRRGRVFIVHFDEESVMLPAELRKLMLALARTDRRILEGPIYYPLEYTAASVVCQSMEANRPVGCFECRSVMEKGVPLHLHGSNLVVEEELENEIGWDIGQLDGNYYIAEDFVFGMNAFLRYGREIFGWHGCVILEQPPFSFKSAFRQRHRWIFGVLQGLHAAQASDEFGALPSGLRFKLIWGARFRMATFAAGSIVGSLAFVLLPLIGWTSLHALAYDEPLPFTPWLTLWMVGVGVLWLGSVLVGGWLNVRDANMTALRREIEILKVIAVAPVAGILESTAGLKAVVDWVRGERGIAWVPTPKTVAADRSVSEGAA